MLQNNDTLSSHINESRFDKVVWCCALMILPGPVLKAATTNFNRSSSSMMYENIRNNFFTRTAPEWMLVDASSRSGFLSPSGCAWIGLICINPCAPFRETAIESNLDSV
ncbi:MAG: hypothetical protein Q4E55_06410 [Bacteroidales bacterium]|nr:hypothetical protein [Bacteroidales bacterium]